MAVSWRLIYNGSGKSFADWGISQIQLNRVSQGMDMMTFVADGKLFDSEQDFVFGGQLEIQRNGVRWFIGTIVDVPRQASGPSESLTYSAAGPWYFLDQTVFKYVWQFRNGNTTAAVPLPSSHLLLNVSNGVWIDTATMLTGAVNYAISRGAPIQVGAISPAAPALRPPIDEVRDISCGEVIRKMLRWHPRAVTWFDYSTQPYPTFHCRAAENLQPVSFSVPPAVGPHPVSYEVKALYEQQRPSVCINYERTHTINSDQYIQLIQDIAPADASGNELGCWTVTVDLQGTKTTIMSADLECPAMPDGGADAEKLAWLVAHCPELQNPNIILGALNGFARRVGSSNLPRELLNGQVADWMNFIVEEDIMFANVNISTKGKDGVITSVGPRDYHPKFRATNGQTGSYQNRIITDDGDPLPVGVAAYLYNQVKDLRYGGTLVMEEDELSLPGVASIGNILNILGGRPEWTNMAALVQQVQEEIDSGRTTITFGPPGHLGPSDLIELTRVNRFRRRETPTSAMTTGRSALDDLKLGKKMPNNESSHSDADWSLRLVRDGTKVITLDGSGGILSILDSAAGAKGVNIAIAACTKADGSPLVLEVAEVPVCTTNAQGQSVTRKRKFIVSPEYD